MLFGDLPQTHFHPTCIMLWTLQAFETPRAKFMNVKRSLCVFPTSWGAGEPAWNPAQSRADPQQPLYLNPTSKPLLKPRWLPRSICTFLLMNIGLRTSHALFTKVCLLWLQWFKAVCYRHSSEWSRSIEETEQANLHGTTVLVLKGCASLINPSQPGSKRGLHLSDRHKESVTLPLALPITI